MPLALIRKDPVALICIVELKDTSGAQSDSGEAGFCPGGIAIPASIMSGPGRVLGPSCTMTSRCEEPARTVVLV
jgi:hypothetical protein